MEAIVLAGGLGTRLKAAVPDVPKPLAPVGGTPFLARLLDLWAVQGVEHFILSVGYQWEKIQNAIGPFRGGVPVTYAVEQSPLGTGGGIRLASRSLEENGPFLVLNGDTFFEVDLRALAAFHHACGAEGTIAVVEMAANTRYGEVKLDDTGRLLGFSPAPRAPEKGLINGGVYLLEKGLVETMGDGKISWEAEALPSALAGGRRLYGFRSRGRFIDIGVPEDYEAARAMFE